MKNLFTVAKYTVLEVYRSKLMIGLVFIAIALLLISYVASEFAYGAPGKVSLDIGIGVLGLSNLIIAVFIGSTLLSKEIEQRTLYMIISRPISRSSFLIGKIFGLSTVLFLNSLILGILSVVLFLFHGGEYQSLFFWCIGFLLIESFVVLLFAVLFSLVTNTTLSVLFSILIYIAGHAINETSKIIFAKISTFFSTILEISFFFLPNLYKLNLKDYLLYQQSISIDYLLQTQLYFSIYIGSMMALIILIFRNKNLD